jgi:hypothetical protein
MLDPWSWESLWRRRRWNRRFPVVHKPQVVMT